MVTDPARTRMPPSLSKLFFVWLVVIFCLKWNTLSEPPVLDAVWGLFTAAGDLADSGFDLWGLLKKPNAVVGGPNTHSEYLVTWITAGVLWLLGKEPQAFAVLHVLHFCTAAWTLAVLHRFTVPIWGRWLASLFCGMLLLCPVFRVQVGAMYFEIPLAACTVAAVVAYVSGHFRRALFWATLGVLVKPTGLVVVGALAVATLCQRGSLTKRWGRSLSLAACGFAAAFWPLISFTFDLMVNNVQPSSSFWQHMRAYHFRYLAVPDITAAVCLVALIGLFRLREVWQSLAGQSALCLNTPAGLPANESLHAESDQPDRVNESVYLRTSYSVTGVSFLLVVMFALFICVMPYYAHRYVFGLPRYLVFILPFVFFALTHWLVLLISPRRAAIVLAVVSLLFVGNREGLWYPKDENDDITVVERGETYRWLVEVQRESAQTAADLPDDVVIYYGFAEHFFMTYPWMGYAHRTHPGGRRLFIGGARTVSLKSADHPDRFFVIYSNPRVLGYEAHILLANAIKDPSRQVRVYRRCQRGPYRIDVFEVTRIVKPTQESDTL